MGKSITLFEKAFIGELTPVDPDVEKNVDKKELQIGIEVEMEHTKDRKVAKLIALQHLDEDPRYYTKLKTIHTDEEDENTVGDGVLGPNSFAKSSSLTSTDSYAVGDARVPKSLFSGVVKRNGLSNSKRKKKKKKKT
jgi:hypothetical protein